MRRRERSVCLRMEILGLHHEVEDALVNMEAVDDWNDGVRVRDREAARTAMARVRVEETVLRAVGQQAEAARASVDRICVLAWSRVGVSDPWPAGMQARDSRFHLPARQ